jgi:hypothetical protein
MSASRGRRAEKTVFAKTLKELYSASRRIKEVRAVKGTFLAVDGSGEPGGEGFQEAITQLYSLAYSTKWTLKLAGVVDFGVSCLECLYDVPKKGEWSWRLLIRIPDAVTAKLLAQPRRELKQRKQQDTSRVKRISFTEGRALQVLHVGPYHRVGPTYQLLEDQAKALGLACRGRAHEIYMSDPRRVLPERLKTIVRLPVRRA